MKRCLQCAEQQESASNFSKYCACHTKWLSWLILVTHETLFCNARSNKCHCPNSPNTAPATKNESHDWPLSHMKRYLQCAEQQVSLSKHTKYCACHEKWISWLILVTHEMLFTMRGATSVIVQTHQILRLPRKMNLMIDPCHTWNAIYNARSNKCHCPNSPNTAPATKNESHDWSLSHMKRYLQCAEQQVSLSKLTKYCACHEKWISWLSLVRHETLVTMRGATRVIVQTHQILRLPRKMHLMIKPCQAWNAVCNARSNKCHCPNSPNTAPATKNESHDWSASHMKRYLQCEYCACHEKWPSRISKKFAENGWNVISNARPIRAWSENDPSMIREWSEHDPTMKPSVRNPPRNRDEHFVLKITTFRAPAIIPNFTEYCACHEKCQFNITKYCACHEKWHSWLILVTHETLFTMRGATSVIVQTHQILRLPRKMNLMIDPWHKWNVIYNARSNMRHSPTHQILRLPRKMTVPNLKEICWKRMKRHFQCAADPTMIREFSRPPRAKNTTFRAPAIIPNFTEYCACHEKWHSNFTKYCACHEKRISWLILVTHETLFTMGGATSNLSCPIWGCCCFFFGSVLRGSSPGRSALQSAEWTGNCMYKSDAN